MRSPTRTKGSDERKCRKPSNGGQVQDKYQGYAEGFSEVLGDDVALGLLVALGKRPMPELRPLWTVNRQPGAVLVQHLSGPDAVAKGGTR
jgi:hypothetical protein